MKKLLEREYALKGLIKYTFLDYFESTSPVIFMDEFKILVVRLINKTFNKYNMTLKMASPM
jgi:hypothetical protein